MLIPFLLLAQVQAAEPQRADRAAGQAARADAEYSGIANETRVQTPRLAGRVIVDGNLSEPQWAGAARLRGFSQYQPLDGRPAEDSTSVLVWYGDDAIYFGIRAYAAPGTVRATLADRDKIVNDDHVLIILDSFNDNRRAFVFAVNPLGVQADGVRSEGTFGGRGPGGFGGPGGGGGGGGGQGPGASRLGITNVDLNQDMIWESKGRITEFGYEVEVRIPFKAVRYLPGEDTWGLNVVRASQQGNYQDTWAPVRRGNSSILMQSGRLTGLHDFKRGLVLDFTPVLTSLTSGRPDTVPLTSTSWYHYNSTQELGGDVRWGIRPNMTINGTVRPDFSQVEADAGQLPGDVRFALFFPELRPFFVEGSENFDTPGQLVYTRNIVRPVAAAKLIGKVSSTDVAVLSAMDDRNYSVSGRDNPSFNVVRMRRDVGAQSTMGFLLTDREEGKRFNRVGGLDGRFVFGRVYNVAFQYAASTTDTTRGDYFGRLWESSWDRSGRTYGFRNAIRGLSSDFRSQTGFVSRTNLVDVNLNQRYSWFGPQGSRIESVILFLSAQSLWTYAGFFDQRTPLESRLSLSTSASVRGGWTVSINPVMLSTRFDPASYAKYYQLRPNAGFGADTVKFVPGPRVQSAQLQMRIQTPQFARFGASLNTTYGDDAEFLETAQARRLDVNASVDFRPTPQARITASMLHQEFVRKRDQRAIVITNIPRLKLEYQASRAILFRFVGQYDNRLVDAYRDPDTGNQVVFKNADGTWSTASGSRSNGMRVDWLVAFLPSPGRVLYVGYGAGLTQTDAFSFREKPERTNDGLFVKLSYQIRVQ